MHFESTRLFWREYDAMSLTEWLKTAYGVDFVPANGLHGGPLAEALCRALEEADLDYGSQRAALHEAADRLHDLAFSNACLDHVDAIDAYLADDKSTDL